MYKVPYRALGFRRFVHIVIFLELIIPGIVLQVITWGSPLPPITHPYTFTYSVLTVIPFAVLALFDRVSLWSSLASILLFGLAIWMHDVPAIFVPEQFIQWARITLICFYPFLALYEVVLYFWVMRLRRRSDA